MKPIRIKWSDIMVHRPMRFIWLNPNSSKFYLRKYVLVEAMFDFGGGKCRKFEMSMPWYPFKDAILLLPIEKQKMIKNNPCRLEIEKLDRGKMRINRVEIYKLE